MDCSLEGGVRSRIPEGNAVRRSTPRPDAEDELDRTVQAAGRPLAKAIKSWETLRLREDVCDNYSRDLEDAECSAWLGRAKGHAGGEYENRKGLSLFMAYVDVGLG